VLHPTLVNLIPGGATTLAEQAKPGPAGLPSKGVNRKYAVLGVSDQCIAAYPGDFAQAMVALGA